MLLCGEGIAQKIKGTPGITAWFLLRVRIDREGRDLDVGSSHPGAEEGPKGWTVRPLKWYASWVQTVVKQVGLYLPDLKTKCFGHLVREDW